ncbi:MAG: amidohydrolase family protein, partial [Candidatus Eremiobacteraeota bacterium]|nr:amidohydrolase family protein [Candidatus Eremiobacteraeota bacterium]
KAFEPIARAAIAYAHSRGARVIIHAVELETARLAVQSGTDILAHSVFDTDVDDAFIELLHARNVIYTPTLIVVGNYGYTFHGKPNLTEHDLRFANPDVVATLFQMQDVESALPAETVAAIRSRRVPEAPHAAMRNLKRIHDAGIRIAAGTDAGNIGTQHASSLYDEFITMVDCGLSARDVLKTATQGGAALLNRSPDLGTIAPGKIADLAILEADPLADIRAVAHVRDVVKGGVVYKAATLVHEPLEYVVQRQANAFNFHDAAVFAESYAPHAKMRRDGKLIASSRAEIQAYYAERFKKYAALHTEILSRDTRGSTVTDKQRVMGISDKPEDATLTFTLQHGLIEAVDVQT